MIRIFENSEQLAQAAAELFADQARRAVAARGRFCVALAGGSTPRQTYQQLARSPLREQIPWTRIHIFWGDERCVPVDDPRSNAHMAREALLEHVPIPADQIHNMSCAKEPEAAARIYQQLLQDFFQPDPPRFDLILLGLGEDGHTASLFPGTPGLQQREQLVILVQKPGEDFARLSLSLPLINLARMLVFLVSGPKKTRIFKAIQRGPAARYPAQLIAPSDGELQWLVDREAAGGESAQGPA
jgi:6-phosphogluconolactonase